MLPCRGPVGAYGHTPLRTHFSINLIQLAGRGQALHQTSEIRPSSARRGVLHAASHTAIALAHPHFFWSARAMVLQYNLIGRTTGISETIIVVGCCQ